jgi:5-methylthioadenosine/S-adenosylhomocysteine deaminase
MVAYAASAADVRDTVVDGRILMRDRELLTLDEPSALAALHELADIKGSG